MTSSPKPAGRKPTGRRTRAGLVGLVAAVIILAPRLAPAPPRVVPQEYRALYAKLNACLFSLHRTIDGAWDHSLHEGLVPMASVLTANSNAGPALLTPESRDATRQFIGRLRELGCRGLQLDIQFPVLDPDFYAFAKARGLMPLGDPEAEDYLLFYKSVVRDIRGQGLKVSVESQVIFTQAEWSPLPVGPYYSAFDADGQAGLSRYIQRKKAMIKTIASELAPDYLTVCDEPETEMDLTGIELLRDASRYLDMVAELTAAARLAGPAGLKVGNGFCSWSSRWSFWVDELLRLGNDFLNVHVYPLDLSPALDSGAIIGRILEAADRARAAGRSLALGEAWLYKMRAGETDPVVIYGRDYFDFWQPLDVRFLSLMLKIAHFKRFEYVSPFWSLFFYSYLTYAEAKDMSLPERRRLNNFRAIQNIAAGMTTDTGSAYGRMITKGPAAAPMR